MTDKLKQNLILVARSHQTNRDISHDFHHALRVMGLAEKIGLSEKADMDILLPSALFHDLVIYPKNDPNSEFEQQESAERAAELLKAIPSFPNSKIKKVQTCITECSFSKNKPPSSIESQILQDADRLEACGAISIMRTFSSGNQMGMPFYDENDPLCKKSTVRFRSSIDLFFQRLLLIEDHVSTVMAKDIARNRVGFLRVFLDQFEDELRESGII